MSLNICGDGFECRVVLGHEDVAQSAPAFGRLLADHPDDDEGKAGEPLDRFLARRLRSIAQVNLHCAALRWERWVQLIKESVRTESVQDRGTSYPALMPDPIAERWAASGLMALTGSVEHRSGHLPDSWRDLIESRRRSRISTHWLSWVNVPR